MRWTIIQQADGTWAVVDDLGAVIDGTVSDSRELAVDRLRELAASALGELPEGGVPSGRGARFRMRYQEGERTSDGRIIDPGATNFNRPPPLPLMLTTQTSEGHLGAQLSGVIDEARREGTTIVLEGNFDAGSEAGREHERLVREGVMTTWSPDLGDCDIVLESLDEPDGEEDDVLGLLLGLGETLMHLASGTLLGGTGVPFPALASARIEEMAPALAASLVAGGMPYVRSTGSIEILDAVTAAGEPCVDCEDQREATVVEAPAPVDLLAHVAALTGRPASEIEAMTPEQVNALLTSLQPRPLANGGIVESRPYLIGETGPEEVHVEPATVLSATLDLNVDEAMERVEQVGAALDRSGAGYGRAVAAAARMSEALDEATFRPAPEWFADPGFDGPTPMTVTPEGRVLGHLAQWGVCHTGILDRCVLAPHSFSDYAYFMQGAVTTADGERRRVGHLTVGCGHANLSLDADSARAHYDGGPGAFVAAHVAVGEDDHGIWFSGVVDPRLDDFQRWELETLAISGDWRMLGGHLELIAALSVPVPGFPILTSAASLLVPNGDPVPRPELLLSRGEVTAITAAGTLAPRRVALGMEVASLRRRVEQLEARLESRTEPLLPSVAKSLSARLRGDRQED